MWVLLRRSRISHGLRAGSEKVSGRNVLALAASSFLLASCSSGAVLQVPLTAVGQVTLPAEPAKPSVDLLSLDPRSARLYVSHSSRNALDVIDLKEGLVLGSVPDLPGIKAIAVTSDPMVVFTSNAGEGSVAVVDVPQLKVITKIRVGGHPDAIDYDQFHDLVIVSLGAAKKMAFIERQTYKVITTFDLPGAPELMTVDPKGGRLFVAIHDMNQVVAIDIGTHQVTATYKGCDITTPTGVAYDAEQGRLFVASSRRLNIIDLLLDKCLGVVDIGSGVDQIAINPHTHHLYTANGGSRNLSVIDTVTLKPLGIVGTGPGAATLAVDPTTDRVYVAIARTGIIAIYHDP